MSNTIEKALQKQQAKQQDTLQGAQTDTRSTLEKAEAAKQRIDDAKANQTEQGSVQTSSPAISPSESSALSANAKPAKSVTSVTREDLFIDLERLDKNGHVSVTGERKVINEEYREIKRKLLANAFGPLSSTIKHSNIMMVTSSRPSEGKTFTACNLALSIAIEQDKTVLLVDADVLRPNVMRTLGVNASDGLMEYLLGETNDIADVMYPTNIDKLKIIPAGKSHHLSTELLASAKMSETVAEFSSRYSDRVVIIDSPPLIGINETAVLANFAGQAVVVVEEGRAKLSDIKASIERLNPDMAIGFVVNKSVNNDDGSGYYGYYGYHYADRKG